MRWLAFVVAAVVVAALPAGTPAEAKSHQNEDKISPALLDLVRANPRTEIPVIVSAAAAEPKGHRSERAAKAVKDAHGQVGRGLSIVGGVSGQLTGDEILDLAQNRDVAYISLDDVVTATFDPTQGALLASSPGILEVAAPDAWRQLGVTGRGVGVAVLDSGIAPHADLAGRIVASVDFTSGVPGGALVAPADPGGHGTHVAGLIGGDGTASGGMYAGVAPGANLIDVRVISATGSTNVSTLIQGMQWVLGHRSDYNIRVANLSLGARATTSYRNDPLATAVEVLTFAGVAVVVSAGNEGPGASTITTPGDDPFVITVGAIDDSGTATLADDALASWSSRGPTAFDNLAKPDLVAPGRKIVSLRSPGSTLDQLLTDRLVAGLDPTAPAYFRLSGTSMAAPVVAGVVALMLERDPSLTPAQVKHRLRTTAARLDYGSATTTGGGLVNALAAVASTDAGVDASTDPVSDGFASEMFTCLNGQPFVWRDLTYHGGVDSSGRSWSDVTWGNVTWDEITWENLSWASFSWANVTWQDIVWEDVTWEDVTWDTVWRKDKTKNRGWSRVS